MIKDCADCKLCQTRTQIVNGRGNPDSPLWLIGRDPGREEDKVGLPFIGRAGKRMSSLIPDIEANFYIVNLVRCHTPQNRGPQKDEIDACMCHLMAEIAEKKPKLLITLGKEVTSVFLQKDAPMTAIRGEIIKCGNVMIMPTYHPSYLVRCGHKHDEAFKSDIEKARQYVQTCL